MDTQETHLFRPVPGLDRSSEEEQLAGIIGIAQENLEKAEQYGAQLSDELHELMETYGTKDKEALAMFHNTQSQLRENQRDLLRCRKARRKPYFGRIDFRDPRFPQDESYYVGRVGISRNGSEPTVIDWRAPIASVYYENGLGSCTYTVKNEGSHTIDLKRKRTYEIADDRLIDFFDSDVVANDELLTKYLARNKSAVLGEIIATIQKEQNAVIRRSPRMNLIVQGAAGSGKTTVAMHRISYILYNYKEDFRPEDFYIIGSSRILLNYITSVLPDLDVYGVSQMTMEQLFIRLLYEDWDPALCSVRHPARAKDKGPEDAMRIKGSYDWFHDLERFCRDYEEKMIPVERVMLDNGVLLMKESTIRSCLKNNPLVSMQGKINMLNRILLARLENETTGRQMTYPPDVKKELQRKYRRHFGRDVWKGSVFEVYQDFLAAQAERGKAVPPVGTAFDLYDLAALAFIYKRIKEIDGIREASHVIIDEAQDFGMTAYGALAYCLRGCTYTIMGDVSQNIHFGYGLNDWEELKELLLKGLPDGFGVLKKSYRNTVEISDFATDILRHGSFPVYPADPIRRHGAPVRIVRCRDEAEMIRETAESVRKWQADGRETIAVICRDEEEASRVKRYLGSWLPLADTDPETADFTKGIMVLPVEYTKGLEFDAVLLYHPSEGNYPAEDAYVKLLYVAATRALHELAVVHMGDLTDLIGKPAPKRELNLLPEPSKKDRPVHTDNTGRPAADGAQAAGGPRETGYGADTMRINSPDPAAVPSSLSQCAARRPLHAGTSGVLPVNPSPYPFGAAPDSRLLHRKAETEPEDFAIRDIKRTRQRLDLISRTGILRLTPVNEAVIRIQFLADTAPSTSPRGWWDCRPKAPVPWTARAGKSLVELSTQTLKIQADRRSGALRFFDRDGCRLLSENTALPRRVEVKDRIRTWEYFDWQKSEKLSAKGILTEDLKRMDHKARYISFGGKRLRMPLPVSEYGYGLGIAAEETVLCCNIPMYGTYLYTEGDRQIDYYFLCGKDYGEILKLYQKLQKKS